MEDVCGGCADGAGAHHHAGLAVAAGGGGEGRARERDEMPGPKGNGSDLGILIPSLICKLYTLALLLLFFLHKKVLSLL